MFTRLWDPDHKYSAGVVKEYTHWVHEVSFRQHTLGSCILFAKRSVEKISDLNDEELLELKHVMRELEQAFTNIEAFQPNRVNYLQLGNAVHQLHFHVIPRYAQPREFLAKDWIDSTFGHPPKWSQVEEAESTVTAIRDEFLRVL